MPVSCTPNDLAALAACYSKLSERERAAITTYLLTVIAGVEPDPDALAEASKCLDGIPPGDLPRINAWLLCQIVNA